MQVAKALNFQHLDVPDVDDYEEPQSEILWCEMLFVLDAHYIEQMFFSEQAEWQIILKDSLLSVKVWPELEKIAIDNAVAEPAAAEGRVAVVPATFGEHIPLVIAFADSF